MLMTRSLTAGLVATAAALGACRGAQTDDPVVTRTSGGEYASPSGDSADKRGVALVRVVNASPTPGRYVVRADSALILATVDYKAVSPYTSIDRTWASLEIGTPEGTYSPLDANREVLTDGHRYTLVILRDGDQLTTRVLQDEITDDTTMARLRVIHAASDIDEVDIVRRNGDEIFEGVNFRMEAGFKAVEPWSGTLEIRTEDGNRLLHSIPSMSLEAGRSHTIVLTRGANGRLEVITFSDEQV